MQQNLNAIKCGVSTHQNSPAVFYCTNESCQSIRNFCYECYKNGMHPHSRDVYRIDQLPQFLSCSLELQNLFICQLQAYFRRLREAQAQSIKIFENQYQMNEDWLANISGQQLNRIITETVGINSIKSKILEKLADLTNIYNNDSMKDGQVKQAHSFNSNISEVQFNSDLQQNSKRDSQPSNTTVINDTPTQLPSSNINQNILKLNVEQVLVVEQQGVIIIAEKEQGTYVLQGKNNYILNEEANYQSSDWEIKEQYVMQEPVTIEQFFKAGGNNKDQICNPQTYYGRHAQTRIIEYRKMKKIIQQQMKQ